MAPRRACFSPPELLQVGLIDPTPHPPTRTPTRTPHTHTQVDWKLTRGKWRPRLQQYARELGTEAVRGASLRALGLLAGQEGGTPPAAVKEAIAALTVLKARLCTPQLCTVRMHRWRSTPPARPALLHLVLGVAVGRGAGCTSHPVLPRYAGLIAGRGPCHRLCCAQRARPQRALDVGRGHGGGARLARLHRAAVFAAAGRAAQEGGGAGVGGRWARMPLARAPGCSSCGPCAQSSRV